MAAMSKLFEYLIENDVKCTNFFHKYSCKTNSLLITYKFLLSNMKYFAPIIGLPLLLRIRSLNKKVLLATLQYYVEAVMTGTAIGWSVIVSICISRHIFGKFTYLSTLLLPTFVGSFGQYIVPSPRVHRLFAITIFQCTLESLIIQKKTVLAKLIANSSLLRTFMFMCCSALILNAKRRKAFNGFWLMEPTPQNAATVDQEANGDNGTCNSTCGHKIKSCKQYALQGIRNFMMTGLALDAIKMLLANVPADVNGFTAKLWVKLKTFKIRSAALLTSYVAIYRLLHCYFNRNFGGDSQLKHGAAAFLSGSCFIFFPKLTLLCYALILGVQISWKELTTYLSAERFGGSFEWIQRLPCRQIIYPAAVAYLVHTYALRKRHASNLGGIVVDGITNNYVKFVHANVERIEQLMAQCTPTL
uniref:Transmembrane protein 135 n=1 Tax=Zeugodacus cucurbitae TaxID=28588 RepID=A0A0A1WP46_ZEUCU